MAGGYRLQHGCNVDSHVQRTVRQPIHRMLALAIQKGTHTMTDHNTVVVNDGGGSGAGTRDADDFTILVPRSAEGTHLALDVQWIGRARKPARSTAIARSPARD